MVKRQLSVQYGFGVVTAFMVLFSAVPVFAQSGNQSDVTGAGVTFSDIAGGAFAPPAVSAGTSVVTIYSNPGTQDAVNIALNGVGGVGGVASQLRDIFAAGLTDSGDGSTDSGGGLTDSEGGSTDFGDGSTEPRQTLINRLANESSGVSETQAERLVTALESLLQVQSVSAAQLLEVVNAYNDIVNSLVASADDSLLKLLQQIRSALAPLVDASR